METRPDVPDAVSITAPTVAELATRLRALQHEHNIDVRRAPFESDIDKLLAARRASDPNGDQRVHQSEPAGSLLKAIASMEWETGRPVPPDVAVAIAAQVPSAVVDADTTDGGNLIKTEPPLWCEYGLYLLLPKKHRENVPGDLREEFELDILPRFGPRAAKLWYFKESIVAIAALLPRRWRVAFGVALAAKLLPTIIRILT